MGIQSGTGEADLQPFGEREVATCRPVPVGALRDNRDVDSEECCGTTQLVVLGFGDDVVVECGIYEPAQELPVCPFDLLAREIEIVCHRSKFGPFFLSEFEIAERLTEQHDVRGDIGGSPDTSSEGRQVRRRFFSLARSAPAVKAGRSDFDGLCRSRCAWPGESLGDREQQPGGCVGVDFGAVGVATELDAVLSACDTKLAAGHFEGVEAVTPLDEDAGSGEFGGQHPLVEGQVVTNNDSSVEPGSDVMGDVVEHGCVGDHFGGDLVKPGRPDVTARVDEGFEDLVDRPMFVDRDDGDLDDAVLVVQAGGFDIDDGETSTTFEEMTK